MFDSGFFETILYWEALSKGATEEEAREFSKTGKIPKGGFGQTKKANGKLLTPEQFRKATEDLAVILLHATLSGYKGSIQVGVWKLYELKKGEFTSSEQETMKEIITQSLILYYKAKSGR